MEFTVTKCPHCSGVSGVQTTIRFKALRLHGWDGEDEDTDGFEVLSETDPRCQDCNKPVRAYVIRDATSAEFRDVLLAIARSAGTPINKELFS